MNTYSGEYQKVFTFKDNYNFIGAVGLTRTKILFAMPTYAKIVLYKWNPLEKIYIETNRAKLSQHSDVFLSNMKLNLFSSKHSKEILAVYYHENIYKFTLDERDLMLSKRKAVFRMKKQKCIDFKVVDADHVLILYSYLVVILSLKESIEMPRQP